MALRFADESTAFGRSLPVCESGGNSDDVPQSSALTKKSVKRGSCTRRAPHDTTRAVQQTDVTLVVQCGARSAYNISCSQRTTYATYALYGVTQAARLAHEAVGNASAAAALTHAAAYAARCM